MTRTLVVGDVHGCLQELQTLLQQVGYSPPRDRLILVGDLVDRGPASVEAVKFVRRLHQESGAICLMGNHDEKYVRYRGWLEKTGGDTALVKMHFPPEKQDVYRRLEPEDLDWLSSLPYYFREDGFLVVHAGLCPRRHKQPEDLDNPRYRVRLTRIRNVDADGCMLGLSDSDPAARHWSEDYDGRFGLAVYGHDPTADHLVRRSEHALGIDTGCCFGGRLTALVLNGKGQQVVQVPAQEKYADFGLPED